MKKASNTFLSNSGRPLTDDFLSDTMEENNLDTQYPLSSVCKKTSD